MYQGVFLDRDGVINEVLSKRVKFVNDPGDFHFLPGALEGMRILTEGGFKLFVVTNQGGVGLGYMKSQMLDEIHSHMLKEISAAGGEIVEVSACIHKPHEGCLCRKPGPKMIMDLAQRHSIDLNQSYMIGDREVDIEAGRAAETKNIFIGDKADIGDNYFPSLLNAAEWLVSQKQSDQLF
ncbi:HAD family hydrolase [Bacillus tianshenii]|uniref:D-glycero-alpha-D-manno-heptose-1,7-bisphosphate 7-phosphatase n=1 Tax=Sutcliffiella tianshenii TaxID=1463404 RepID=UPI001CD717DD|nr:HAD family hydrolase [Bacillus tianshenii]MCA1319282.1 HAD family hydrolase [Bacillus tianshenii]